MRLPWLYDRGDFTVRRSPAFVNLLGVMQIFADLRFGDKMVFVEEPAA